MPLPPLTLANQRILITGAAKRVGRSLALACARAGADVVIHYGQSAAEAQTLAQAVEALGQRADLLQADLADPAAVAQMIPTAAEGGPLTGLIHNASLFAPLDWQSTTRQQWDEHLQVNLTTPFLLSQAFARALPAEMSGSILTLLDWRALRPGADHLPYTISKAGLAALTRSLAAALAPRIRVNGLALGAILPANEGGAPAPASDAPIRNVPAGRWAALEEVDAAALFLLAGPGYITGEIVHVDGGRQLI